MKTHHLKTIRLLTAAATLLAVLFAGNAWASGKALFLGEAQPSGRGASAAAQIASLPEVANLRVVRADPAAVAADSREIDIDLGLARVKAFMTESRRNPDGSLTWIGHVREHSDRTAPPQAAAKIDPMNSVIMVRIDRGITGSVRVKGKLYRIQPLPDGAHAIVEVNESRLPPDHPHDYGRYLQEALSRQGHTANSPRNINALVAPGETKTVRVAVYVSSSAASGYTGDMRALVNLAFAEANQSYVNSNMGIVMQLAGYYVTNYADSGNFSTDLDRFTGKTDGYLDDAHTKRNQVGADVSVLFNNTSNACGVAWVNADESRAFAVVYWGCATGNYTFAHEIGHVQGATHNPEVDSNSAYPYGHGYLGPGSAWRTIMAYDCSSGCPRLNYWSSPEISYQGQPMGTAAKHDNRRVLIETKERVSGFRGAPTDGGGANQPPAASMTSLANGTNVAFLDTSTDVDGSIVARAWNFGDGNTSAEARPSHTYASAGSYVASLTVTDDKGATSSASAPLTVTSGAQPLALTKDVAREGLTGTSGASMYFSIAVPSGASNLKFSMSGGSGNADFAANYGSVPTDSARLCSAGGSTNTEGCTIASLQAGTYYARVKIVTSIVGVKLVATYQGGSGGTTYSVSGSVLTDAGTPVSGVNVGNGLTSTTTNSSGAYVFSNLANGTYTLTPTLSGYTFSPANLSVTVNGANVTGRNFKATASGGGTTYSVSGSVLTDAGTPVSGVNISNGATSTTTNSSGAYVFSNLANGTYTLTPTLSGYTFSPANLSVTVNGANATGQNFRATASGGVQTYSNTTDVQIRDNATVESSITVSGRTGNAPASTPIAVDIKHTYIGDLKVDLVAPDGSVYTLHNRTGGSADNIVMTYSVALSSEPLNGTWKLRVNDNARNDVGYIDSWSVTF